MKYFEDIEAGEVWQLGSRTIDADEITAFARKYDPQPFHLNAEAAKATPMGTLIASGWQTCAIFMGLFAEFLTGNDYASMGAPGIDKCRWLAPVRPGDTLTAQHFVLATRRSQSRPFGIVQGRSELINQNGTPVLLVEGVGLYGLRPQQTEAAS